MAVIINEFEIIPDDKNPTEKITEEPEQMAVSTMTAVSPADVGSIVQHQVERELRLRAH